MVFDQTAEFNQDVCGVKRPLVPTRLDMLRADWFVTAAREELQEFIDADNIEDEIDAILDLMYFAGGRLHEMGVRPEFAEAMFSEIHQANMQKQRGSLAKRPGSKGHDAIKPECWTPPNIGAILAQQKRPKLLIVGHGRHGKDTVGEMLRDKYGLSFKSSSLFCAEKVMWPLYCGVEDPPMHLDISADRLEDFVREDYVDAEECYERRHDYRDVWFEAIKAYCDPLWRLGRDILAEHDVYCGVRNPAELNGIWNAGLADAIVWVDAMDRLPPEDASSMKLEPWMATHVLDNNGTIEQLEAGLDNLMESLYG